MRIPVSISTLIYFPSIILYFAIGLILKYREGPFIYKIYVVKMSRVKNLQFLTIQLTDHWMAHDLNSDNFLPLVIIQFSW